MEITKISTMRVVGEESFMIENSFSQMYPRVSIVVPTLNEADNLPHFLARIPEWIYEVVLVDGYSTDGTVAIAQELKEDIRIVFQSGKGKGDALITGFNAARGDVVVMLDADCSTDPAEIPVFVGALLAGADFVKGSRFVQGAGTDDMPLIRRLGNFGFVMLVRLLFGGHYTDLCYGYNAMWRRVIPGLMLDADGFEIETQMNIRALSAGLKVVEVPSFESNRLYGDAKLHAIRDGLRIVKTIFIEFFKQFSLPQVPIGKPEHKRDTVE